MRQLLTKEDVAKAISVLCGQNKKPTLAAIHAALGHRGSMSTLVRIKGELDTDAQPIKDSEEGLQTFREVWALAFESGKKQGEALATELGETVKTLALENERLEAEAAAAVKALEELEKDKSRAESELQRETARLEGEANRAKTALSEASSQAAAALQKLADAQFVHASQVNTLQADLSSAVHKTHELELRLTRALALLEAKTITAEPPVVSSNSIP